MLYPNEGCMSSYMCLRRRACHTDGLEVMWTVGGCMGGGRSHGWWEVEWAVGGCVGGGRSRGLWVIPYCRLISRRTCTLG